MPASPCTRGAEVTASRPASKGARLNKPCASLITICRHARRLPGLKAALIKAYQVVAKCSLRWAARTMSAIAHLHPQITQRFRRVALLLYV